MPIARLVGISEPEFSIMPLMLCILIFRLIVRCEDISRPNARILQILRRCKRGVRHIRHGAQSLAARLGIASQDLVAALHGGDPLLHFDFFEWVKLQVT